MPVRITPTWLIFIAWITIVFAPLVSDRLPDIGGGAYAVSAAFGVFLGLSILVHELSHAIVARLMGLPVREITLQLLGGATTMDREPTSPGRQALVAGVGPVVSLALGGCFWALYTALQPDTVLGLLAGGLAISNLIVGVFNLLPGLPLDGGQVLRAAVWGATGRPLSGTIAAAWTGRALAALLVVGTLIAVGFVPDTISLAGVLWAGLLAWYMWAGANVAERAARVQQHLPSITVGALTRRAMRVPADLPLGEAVRRAHEANARGLIVVDSGGEPIGIADEASVIATPAERRPWVSVWSVARAVKPEQSLSTELDGEGLLAAIQRTPAPEYVVVQPDGTIYGVLASADVAAAVGMPR